MVDERLWLRLIERLGLRPIESLGLAGVEGITWLLVGTWMSAY
jgi:hypothetical protein